MMTEEKSKSIEENPEIWIAIADINMALGNIFMQLGDIQVKLNEK